MLGFGTEQVLALLRGSGALFTSDIARRLARTEPPLSLPEVEHALALLEDAGFITNDLFSHTGRWSVAEARAGADAAGQVEALLMRYGVVCREVCRAEKRRWADVERVLKMWEWRGRALRGDFVRHLSGPQFALREAVELLRQEPAGEAPLLLSWEDPANPWGKVLPLPAPRGKGRFILLLGGQPLLTITGWGKELQPAGRWSDDLAEVAAPALRLLAVHSPTRQAALERWRGGSILVSPLAAPLREAGFVRAGLRLVHRPRDAARLDLAV